MWQSLSRWLRRPPPCSGRRENLLTRPVRRAAPARVARPAVEELEGRVQPSGVPRPDHVVMVIEENHSYSQVLGSPSTAPYMFSLATSGANMTNSFALTHPSQG